MSDVLGEGGLAQAAGADEDGIGGVLQEFQAHQFGDGRPVTLLGPVPIEVGQGLEASDVRIPQAPFEATLCPFGFLPGQQGLDPGTVGQFLPMREQPMEMQGFRALAQDFHGRHRRSP